MLLDQLPQQYHSKIKETSDTTMIKIMEMMSVRLRYEHEIKNHFYLFGDPDYTNPLGTKFQQKIKQSAEVNRKILNDIYNQLGSLSELSSKDMNDLCNAYVLENRFTTEDVFYLIRFALTGNPVGASMADIAEVITLEQTRKRLLAAINSF
jgi:glutamyl/glutaminyl-tRNA synthetase